MTLYAQPTALFAANNHRFALHQRADVLEPDRRLVHVNPKHLRHRIHQMTGCHGAHHRPFPAPVLYQVIECQRQHLVGRQKRAVAVDHRKTIRIRIQPEPERVAPPFQAAGQLAHVFADRFRVTIPKQRV